LYKQLNKTWNIRKSVRTLQFVPAASTPWCLSADYSKPEQRDRIGLGDTGSLSEFLSMLDRVLIRISVQLLLDFSWDPPLVKLQNISETEAEEVASSGNVPVLCLGSAGLESRPGHRLLCDSFHSYNYLGYYLLSTSSPIYYSISSSHWTPCSLNCRQ
jgi:hypothetical protein